jgi:hypothetical protein
VLTGSIVKIDSAMILNLDGGNKMTSRIAFPLLAVLAVGACSGRVATAPMNQSKSPGASVANRQGNDNDQENSPRSGALHVTKECSEYTRLAGSFCTITSSNLKQIPVGTKVVYTLASGPSILDTDVTLQPPKPGHSVAFGHVVLNLVTAKGVVTLSGGTGKFKSIHARADVTHLTGKNWAWDGTYTFSNDDNED